MCAHAVRVAVRKIEGVESVEVSLNGGYALLTLASRNSVTVQQVRDAIRDNGFTPREARVRVRGRIVRRGEVLVLETPGAGPFALTASADLNARLAAAAGGPATTLDGVVAETARGAVGPPVLRVVRLAMPESEGT